MRYGNYNDHQVMGKRALLSEIDGANSARFFSWNSFALTRVHTSPFLEGVSRFCACVSLRRPLEGFLAVFFLAALFFLRDAQPCQHPQVVAEHGP